MPSSSTPLGKTLPAEDITRLGLVAIELAANFASWVRRRKTAYTFVDETTVSQRLSIDFSLPTEDWFNTPIEAGETIYVPLGVFRKEALAAFSISDGHGEAVSTLNRFETADLAIEGFSALVDGYGGEPGIFREDIAEVVDAATLEEGSEAYERALRRGLRVLPDSEYRTLLREHRGGFMMLVPVTYCPGATHLLKVEWSSPFAWSEPRLGARIRTLFSSLGLWRKDLWFEDLPIGWAQSTHFEFSQPEGARQLRVLLQEQRDESVSGADELRSREQHARPQADLSLPIADLTDPASSRSRVAKVTVSLRSRRSGAFAAIVVASCMATGLMWTVAARLGELDMQSSSAVALVLPALLAAYLVRSEHAIAGRLLAGTRVIGLIVAGAAFAAALVISVGDLRTLEPHGVQTAQCATALPGKGLLPARPAQSGSFSCILGKPPATAFRANPGVQRAVAGLALLTSICTGILILGLACTQLTTTPALRRAVR